MRFLSFNINGLRAHLHQIDTIITDLQPDVIGLQETKVHNNFFPIKELLRYGYHIYYSGQKKYYGVALLLRQPPLKIIQTNINNNNLFQSRIIIANIMTTIGALTIINAYFPQGDNKNNVKKFISKKNFYKNLQEYIELTYHTHSLLIIMGDMNISPTDLDIGFNENNKKHWIKSGKCSFLPEERLWMQHLLNWGFIDIYRHIHPKNNSKFSWFSYKSKGFLRNNGLRIDLILATQPLANRCKNCDISYNVRKMDRPSDHAPIWADIDV